MSSAEYDRVKRLLRGLDLCHMDDDTQIEMQELRQEIDEAVKYDDMRACVSNCESGDDIEVHITGKGLHITVPIQDVDLFLHWFDKTYRAGRKLVCKQMEDIAYDIMSQPKKIY